MGMYTEFFFRAPVKGDTPDDLIAWLQAQSESEGMDHTPYNDHPFFSCDHWPSLLHGAGAVYQDSRPMRFVLPDPERPWVYPFLSIHSSLKDYGGEVDEFIDWISPHLDLLKGEFLGYKLYELDDTPTLFHLGESKKL